MASLFDAPALSANDLALAPRGSVWVGLASLDLGQIMDVIRDTTTAVGPEAADPFEESLANASGMLGMDVEARLIRGFGGTWALYLDPDTTGDSLAGLTIVNPLQDPEGVERHLKIVQSLGGMALLDALSDSPVKLSVQTQQYEDLEVHTFLVPMVAPSWAVIDGKLVVGLYPQSVLAAHDRFQRPGSIVENQDFAALRDQIGTRRLTGLSWVDLPKTVDTTYGSMISTETLLTGLAAIGTGQPMPRILPPLGRLRPHLTPAHSFGYVDETGWHSLGRSPFPGASMFAPQASGSALTLPFAGSMLWGMRSAPQFD